VCMMHADMSALHNRAQLTMVCRDIVYLVSTTRRWGQEAKTSSLHALLRRYFRMDLPFVRRH